jgi:hypothetical protein
MGNVGVYRQVTGKYNSYQYESNEAAYGSESTVTQQGLYGSDNAVCIVIEEE